MQTLTTSVLQNVSSAAAAAAAMSCVWTVAACMHAVWLVYACTLARSRSTVCSASTTMTLTRHTPMCTDGRCSHFAVQDAIASDTTYFAVEAAVTVATAVLVAVKLHLQRCLMSALKDHTYGVTSAEAQKQLARVPVFFIKDPSGMYCMSSLRPYTSVDESLDECGYVQDPLTARALHTAAAIAYVCILTTAAAAAAAGCFYALKT
eukprot:2598-Heterococcus_DN1.PRE.1